MKVYLITKKTLIYAAAAAAVLLIAVLVAIVAGGSSGTNAEADTSGRIARLQTPTLDSGKQVETIASVGTNSVEEYEVEVFAGLMKELPVYSVQRNDRKIALTIDAAWQDDKTPFILSTLEKYNIPATFFLCGFWVKDYPAGSVSGNALAGTDSG